MEKMKKYLHFLSAMPLFEGIDGAQLPGLLECLGARLKSHQKGGIIVAPGEPVTDVGIVLEGDVLIFRDDFSGNRNLLARAEAGEMFAEVLACVGARQAPVTVQAQSGATVLLVEYERIVSGCASVCACHGSLVRNLLKIMAEKNLALNEKVRCVGHRTTREKVTAFLEASQEKAGTNPFDIAFSRAQMADYLCVERSALSAVLSAMRAEGIVDFERNRFELKEGFGL